jgi:hypothetical protein
MPTPIPDSVSATLRSDPTAALGALMVIASAHAELFSWAARMICVAAPARIEPPPKPNEPQGAKAPGARKASTNAQPKSNGTAAHLALRREARDRDDENLRQAMRDSPASSIGDWAETIGKSRTSTVAALHRLRDAGLATNADKVWALVEPGAPREPPPKWVAPLSALSAASHTHI